MAVSLQTVLIFAQTVASISTPIAIFLAVRQFRLVSRQAKKQSDTAAVNFILQAEGNFDRAMEALINAPPRVVRNAYAPEIDPEWDDQSVATFMFLKRLFGQVSRMVFIAHNTAIDLGLSPKDRQALVDDWANTLKKYRNHPIMQRIVANAMRNCDYNATMLALCRQMFDDPAGEMGSTQ